MTVSLAKIYVVVDIDRDSLFFILHAFTYTLSSEKIYTYFKYIFIEPEFWDTKILLTIEDYLANKHVMQKK